jgi:outer membrane biosynthesis protein TonB
LISLRVPSGPSLPTFSTAEIVAGAAILIALLAVLFATAMYLRLRAVSTPRAPENDVQPAPVQAPQTIQKAPEPPPRHEEPERAPEPPEKPQRTAQDDMRERLRASMFGTNEQAPAPATAAVPSSPESFGRGTLKSSNTYEF